MSVQFKNAVLKLLKMYRSKSNDPATQSSSQSSSLDSRSSCFLSIKNTWREIFFFSKRMHRVAKFMANKLENHNKLRIAMSAKDQSDFHSHSHYHSNANGNGNGNGRLANVHCSFLVTYSRLSRDG